MVTTPVAIQHVDYLSKAEERKAELEELRQRSLTKGQAARLQDAEAPTEMLNFVERQREWTAKERNRLKEARAYLNQYRADDKAVMVELEKKRQSKVQERDYSKQAKAYLNNYRADDPAGSSERERRRSSYELERQSVQRAKEFLRTYRAEDSSVLSEFKNSTLSSPSPDGRDIRKNSSARSSFFLPSHHSAGGDVVRSKEVSSWPSPVVGGPKRQQKSMGVSPGRYVADQSELGPPTDESTTDSVEPTFHGGDSDTGSQYPPICLDQIQHSLDAVRRVLAALEQQASKVDMPISLSSKLLTLEFVDVDIQVPEKSRDIEESKSAETQSTCLTDNLGLPTLDSMLNEHTANSVDDEGRNEGVLFAAVIDQPDGSRDPIGKDRQDLEKSSDHFQTVPMGSVPTLALPSECSHDLSEFDNLPNNLVVHAKSKEDKCIACVVM